MVTFWGLRRRDGWGSGAKKTWRFAILRAEGHRIFGTLNHFRRRHARELNDRFTQGVEIARSLGLGRLGQGAIDSTRIAANAPRDRTETTKALRTERARIRRQIRRWQKRCDAAEREEAPGQQIGPERR